MVPLDGPGHGDWEGGIFAQDVHQVLPAGGADGPEGVGAALQLGYRDVLFGIGLQELHGSLWTRRGKWDKGLSNTIFQKGKEWDQTCWRLH